MTHGEWCIMMFFLDRNFATGILCTLKPKKPLRT